MSQKKADTDQILDAIKNMMSDSATVNQELPKDVVELTAPINEEVSQSSANTDVLEPVSYTHLTLPTSSWV